MLEVRKFMPAMSSFKVLFSGYVMEAVEFFKNLPPTEREQSFLFYAGDGTEGV
ncbi:MAG: hypothetical protein HYW90_00500 [Candidatus Sungbacteria bacterium]|nr:hypothetical protein [Candidatus Sungbacteria bacterium]